MLLKTSRRYSLLDPELPLLAVDAAYEIDIFLNSSTDNSSATNGHVFQFQNTTDLIERLKDISASAETVTSDKELYLRSLLPCIEASHVNLPKEPVLLSQKLAEIMGVLGDESKKNDLGTVRDFFLSLSDVSSNTQRWSRGGAASHPYATL